MEKESFWVVTQVVVGRVTLSVNTFTLGWFNDFNEAKRFIEDEYKRHCTEGCEPSKFTHSDWGWTYKSKFFISQVMISLATAG